MGKGIVAVVVVYTNNFHQVEKYFVLNLMQRSRKIMKGDKVRETYVEYTTHKHHKVDDLKIWEAPIRGQ